MKKSTLIITVLACLAGGYLVSCNSSAQKVENAEDKVAAAQKDLDNANAEYLADVEKFREEAAARIAANNKSIADFNARIEKEKASAKADYKNEIAAIEKKNTDLKKKMDDYKADGQDQWQNFKTEFNRDMDELGNAFKNLTTNNTK
jgi:hypothetical protein